MPGHDGGSGTRVGGVSLAGICVELQAEDRHLCVPTQTCRSRPMQVENHSRPPGNDPTQEGARPDGSPRPVGSSAGIKCRSLETGQPTNASMLPQGQRHRLDPTPHEVVVFEPRLPPHPGTRALPRSSLEPAQAPRRSPRRRTAPRDGPQSGSSGRSGLPPLHEFRCSVVRALAGASRWDGRRMAAAVPWPRTPGWDRGPRPKGASGRR